MEQGSHACRRQRLVDAERCGRARHPYRDQERQLAAVGRARGAPRGRAAGRACSSRRADRAGDAALPRGQRDDESWAQQVGRAGLPLLPRAGPGAARPAARSWSRQIRAVAARAAECASRAVRRGEWVHRGRHRPDDQRGDHRPRRRDDRGGRVAAEGQGLVARLPRRSRQRARRRVGRAAIRPGRGRADQRSSRTTAH